ncbi:MAG TPA: hypothetical protein VF762_07880, partial [Blastocatellia bacterium]
MKHILLPKHSNLHPKGLAMTVTLLLFVIIYGLSGGVSTAQAQARAYVTDSCNNAVAVIDTATNILITTIPVAAGPFAIATTPDGTRAYVTH